MEDTLVSIVDSLVPIRSTLQEMAGESGDKPNIWKLVSFVQFAAIGYLAIRWRKAKSRFAESDLHEFAARRKSFAAEEVDMGAVMDSIHKSGPLYKSLSRKCHPDRFSDPADQAKANELFQLISQHRRDYAKLVELQKRVETELNPKT